MKETKYRVWDKKYGKYLGGKILLAPDGQLYEVVDDFHFPKINMDEVTVEQCTGLKDKNGKEIFVGDIVSEHNGDIFGEIIQKRSGEYCIAWIGIFGGSSVLYDELSMCEVIGYIHENPGLLVEATE